MTIGQKIKELREAEGIPQSELSKRLGVSVNMVYFWEREMCEPSIFSCILIADYFNISLDELCRDYRVRK